jgi:hypothetical protein
MARCWIIFVLVALRMRREARRMEQPENPARPLPRAVAVAKQLLEKKPWADRAEWEVLESRHGWEVIAWRVRHRNARTRRYALGYSVIEVDRRMMAVRYRRKDKGSEEVEDLSIISGSWSRKLLSPNIIRCSFL